MTPEEKRLEKDKNRLLKAAMRYSFEIKPSLESKAELFCAAMNYAECVHYVGWLRAKQAEERDKRLPET